MISLEELNRRAEAFLKTDKGKQRYAEAAAKYLESNIDDVMADFEQLFYQKLPDALNGGVGLDYRKERTSNKSWVVYYDFTNVWRPSLNPRKYPDGAHNIIGLFSHGFDTGGKQAYGYWDKAGHLVFGLSHRDPDPFLKDLVDEFNTKYKSKYGVEAVLDPSYL